MAIGETYLKGKRWYQIIDMDITTIQQLDKKALKIAFTRVARAANKRIEKLERENEISPAYVGMLKSGGDFHPEGLTFGQLRREFSRAMTFLKSETATVKGAKAVKNRVVKALKNQDIHITEDDYTKFWQAYEYIKSEHPEVAEKEYKYKVLAQINVMVRDRRSTVNSIKRKISPQLEKIYKSNYDNGYYNGVSRFLGEFQEDADEDFEDI